MFCRQILLCIRIPDLNDGAFSEVAGYYEYVDGGNLLMDEVEKDGRVPGFIKRRNNV